VSIAGEDERGGGLEEERHGTGPGLPDEQVTSEPQIQMTVQIVKMVFEMQTTSILALQLPASKNSIG